MFMDVVDSLEDVECEVSTLCLRQGVVTGADHGEKLASLNFPCFTISNLDIHLQQLEHHQAVFLFLIIAVDVDHPAAL